MKNNKINVGVIGLGVGNRHCQTILEHKAHFNLHGIADFDPEKLKKYGKENISILTQNADEIINCKEIDAVVIASNDEYHCDQIIRAVRSEKHVFVEKPVCKSVAELKSINLILSQHPEVQFSCNLILRKEKVFQQLRQRIMNNELGEIYYVNCSYDYGRFNKVISGWRGKEENYSVILGGAIHLIDLICWATGMQFHPEAKASSAKVSEINKIDFIDLVVGFGKLDNNAPAVFAGNYGSQTNHYHEIKIYGTKGTFTHSQGKSFYSFGEANNNTLELVDKPFPSAGKGELLREFLTDIVNQKKPSLISKIEIMKLMEMALGVENAKHF